jgi:CHAD domain-containing protein
LALRQANKALRHLAANGVDRDSAIHQARRCFKRIRGYLRLLRQFLPAKVYRRENRCYRDAGRSLACLREPIALAQTLDRLAQSHEHAEAFAEFRRALQAVSALQALHAERIAASLVKTLQSARARIADWPLATNERQTLNEGLTVIYQQSRAALKEARRKPSSENFHAWRKHVRYLHDGVKLFNPLEPATLSQYALELRELESYLSELHDLAVLRQWLLLVTQELWPLAQAEPLLNLIHARQSILRGLIKPLGEKLFDQSPKAFAKRFATAESYR